MSIKIEVKAWIHGRRRMLFERLKKEKDINTAALVREIIDFYFEQNPGPKKKY